MSYELIEGARVPIKAWTRGVNVEEQAAQQLRNIANLPIIHDHIAVMPDVHLGKGATVGSVIPTYKAIIPAAVGVDIGCGMLAVQLFGLKAEHIPDNPKSIRLAIEDAVPMGVGQGNEYPTGMVETRWREDFAQIYDLICAKYPKVLNKNALAQLGSLGSGNHFIELCLDQNNDIWVVLHSGSRGAGNLIGQTFINLAKEDMGDRLETLPDKDCAYLEEGTEHFQDYLVAMFWAQRYAATNRHIMMGQIIEIIKPLFPKVLQDVSKTIVHCHHNYVSVEEHFGKEVYLTRKGAVSAKVGEMGIIPGSMMETTYIVEGKGNPDSFHSCSHGAGRTMSRSAARKLFTLEDHIRNAVEAKVECSLDKAVIDETKGCYKDINAVMSAQADLVDILYTLKQFVNVKGQ